MPITIHKPYGKKSRIQIEFNDSSMTKQSFKDDSDINNIMEKYQKTGAIEHANNYSANYGFATSLDLRESLEIVETAQRMFDGLPSKIRSQFGNSPENFLDFVQDPNNTAQMAEMGLIESKAAEPSEPENNATAAPTEPAKATEGA